MTVISSPFIPCLAGRIPNPGGDSMIGGIFPGKDTCTGGTTHLTGGIASGELHSLPCDTVDIWAFVKSGSLITEIPGTHIIDQYEENIGLLGRKRICPKENGRNEANK